MNHPTKQTPFMRSFFGLILPVSIFLWLQIFRLISWILMKIFPSSEHLTQAQYITTLITGWFLILGAFVGLILCVAFFIKYFRLRRDPKVEADLQRRRRASEI